MIFIKRRLDEKDVRVRKQRWAKVVRHTASVQLTVAAFTLPHDTTHHACCHLSSLLFTRAFFSLSTATCQPLLSINISQNLNNIFLYFV